MRLPALLNDRRTEASRRIKTAAGERELYNLYTKKINLKIPY